jgi:hypothetical protein
MALRLRVTLFALALALLVPGLARAAGGSYVFDGGTSSEQGQVRAALDASSFDWSIVPQTITIHIARGHDSDATPGNIWLDADLVDSGQFAWGVVQHEYAHQVDFFLLDDAKRAQLEAALGGSSWWTQPNEEHAQISSERFASTLAWTFWQSKANSMRPTSATDESAALPPAQFKALLARELGVSAFASRTVKR